jgi:hypothetical protein
MLRPFDARWMKHYPVSTRVNSVNNDDAECVAAVNAAQVSLPLAYAEAPLLAPPTSHLV